jgi:hypothetical protein
MNGNVPRLMRVQHRHDLQPEFGLYERELNTFCRRHIRLGRVVYDIGAESKR